MLLLLSSGVRCVQLDDSSSPPQPRALIPGVVRAELRDRQKGGNAGVIGYLDPEEIAELLSVGWRRLAQHCLRDAEAVSVLRNAARDRGIDSGMQCHPNATEDHGGMAVPDAEARTMGVQQALLGGGSIRCDVTDFRHVPEQVRLLLQDIGSAAAEGVRNVNLYVSGPGGQALRPHLDPYNVLVLQVAGLKQWELCEPPSLAPRPAVCSAYASQEAARRGRECRGELLRPGALLWVPQGTSHWAREPGSGDSVHLTFALPAQRQRPRGVGDEHQSNGVHAHYPWDHRRRRGDAECSSLCNTGCDDGARVCCAHGAASTMRSTASTFWSGDYTSCDSHWVFPHYEQSCDCGCTELCTEAQGGSNCNVKRCGCDSGCPIRDAFCDGSCSQSCDGMCSTSCDDWLGIGMCDDGCTSSCDHGCNEACECNAADGGYSCDDEGCGESSGCQCGCPLPSPPPPPPFPSPPPPPPASLPSQRPTAAPLALPTGGPTMQPSAAPEQPTLLPSAAPTLAPSLGPSLAPSLAPSFSPSRGPSASPTVPPPPGWTPSERPSSPPSHSPTAHPCTDGSHGCDTGPGGICLTRPGGTWACDCAVGFVCVAGCASHTSHLCVPLTVSPSEGPSTAEPSAPPSLRPVVQPTTAPSSSPSLHPSLAPMDPSTGPSAVPIAGPSSHPSMSPNTPDPSADPMPPTFAPSEPIPGQPSSSPLQPSATVTMTLQLQPTLSPAKLSVPPTQLPSEEPSSSPTAAPAEPSGTPTEGPISGPVPPSKSPSPAPSQLPTPRPSEAPLSTPSAAPATPTGMPSLDARVRPSGMPSAGPFLPSGRPSQSPTRTPGVLPTVLPGRTPSREPSVAPARPSQLPVQMSLSPAVLPTAAPSHNPSGSSSSAPLASTLTFSPIIHPCTDGSHGCDARRGGGCVPVPGTPGWSCSCKAGWVCVGDCSAVQTPRNCVPVTARPSVGQLHSPSIPPVSPDAVSPSDQPSFAPGIIANPTVAPSLPPVANPTSAPFGQQTGAPSGPPCAMHATENKCKESAHCGWGAAGLPRSRAGKCFECGRISDTALCNSITGCGWTSAGRCTGCGELSSQPECLQASCGLGSDGGCIAARCSRSSAQPCVAEGCGWGGWPQRCVACRGAAGPDACLARGCGWHVERSLCISCSAWSSDSTTCTSSGCAWGASGPGGGGCTTCFAFKAQRVCLEAGCGWDSGQGVCTLCHTADTATACRVYSCHFDASTGACEGRGTLECHSLGQTAQACGAAGCGWQMSGRCTACASLRDSIACKAAGCAFSVSTGVCAPPICAAGASVSQSASDCAAAGCGWAVSLNCSFCQSYRQRATCLQAGCGWWQEQGVCYPCGAAQSRYYCASAGCDWEDDVCIPPRCALIENPTMETCTESNCGWRGGACTSCIHATDSRSCAELGCGWDVDSQSCLSCYIFGALEALCRAAGCFSSGPRACYPELGATSAPDTPAPPPSTPAPTPVSPKRWVADAPPIAPRVGSFSVKMQECEASRPLEEELSLAINPTGLTIGDGPAAAYQGAIVVFLSVVFLVLVLCFVLFLFLSVAGNARMRRRHGALAPPVELLLRLVFARFGYCMYILNFYFPIGVYVAATLLLHADAVLFQIAAGAVLVLALAFIRFVVVIVRQVPSSATVIQCGPQTCAQFMLDGPREWCPTGSPHRHNVYHLFYDSFHYRYRFLLATELGVNFLIALVQSYRAQTDVGCIAQGYIVLILMLAFAVYVTLRRPLLALYDAFISVLVLWAEVLIKVLQIVGSRRDDWHWSNEGANSLENLVLIVLEFAGAIALCLFLRDEYYFWCQLPGGGKRYSGRCVRRVRFVVYWFGFNRIIDAMLGCDVDEKRQGAAGHGPKVAASQKGRLFKGEAEDGDSLFLQESQILRAPGDASASAAGSAGRGRGGGGCSAMGRGEASIYGFQGRIGARVNEIVREKQSQVDTRYVELDGLLQDLIEKRRRAEEPGSSSSSSQSGEESPLNVAVTQHLGTSDGEQHSTADEDADTPLSPFGPVQHSPAADPGATVSVGLDAGLSTVLSPAGRATRDTAPARQRALTSGRLGHSGIVDLLGSPPGIKRGTNASFGGRAPLDATMARERRARHASPRVFRPSSRPTSGATSPLLPPQRQRAATGQSAGLQLSPWLADRRRRGLEALNARMSRESASMPSVAAGASCVDSTGRASGRPAEGYITPRAAPADTTPAVVAAGGSPDAGCGDPDQGASLVLIDIGAAASSDSSGGADAAAQQDNGDDPGAASSPAGGEPQPLVPPRGSHRGSVRRVVRSFGAAAGRGAPQAGAQGGAARHVV
eukprot:TRINITY_DN14057_c0_g1_i1.p1 TRINITY_DN14057_c0_g1~~TRINITY_DN14057_c0_g1_i1.p1  ORF type:complete len:2338 (+),score=88.49 TRINITY_DN14057_c0_g1_i1:99-7016(+)